MVAMETFRIRSLWQERQETSAALAARFRRYLSLSRGVLPDDMRWYGALEDFTWCNVQDDQSLLDRCIEAGIARDEGIPSPREGFNVYFKTQPDNPDETITNAHIALNAGKTSQNNFRFLTDTGHGDRTDPRLVSYEQMRTNMLAIAHSFQPDWCEVGPCRLDKYFDTEVYNRPPMGLAWMIYFSPAVAALVEPPYYATTIVERYDDGSLVLATSTETFDCDNYKHLDAARAIHRQIDMLNYTVPFNGRSGRSDRVPPFPKQ